MRPRLLTALSSFWLFLLAAVVVEPIKHFIDDQIKQNHLLDAPWTLMKGHPDWLGLGLVLLIGSTLWAWLGKRPDSPEPPTPSVDSAREQTIHTSGDRNISVQAQDGAQVIVNVGSGASAIPHGPKPTVPRQLRHHRRTLWVARVISRSWSKPSKAAV
jgi:hypothetical protein